MLPIAGTPASFYPPFLVSLFLRLQPACLGKPLSRFGATRRAMPIVLSDCAGNNLEPRSGEFILIVNKDLLPDFNLGNSNSKLKLT